MHYVDNAEKPMRLLQISDLHFGPPYLEQVGEAALRMANAQHQDAIIINGDLTQRATRAQFEAAKQYIGRLPQVPQIVVPGNHDVPLYRVLERLTDPHRLYREIISQELNPVLKIEGAVIVGLDSTAPRTALSNGKVFKWQLDMCDHVFSETPVGLARIVVAHHHFAPAPDHLHDSNMPHAKRAIERFSDLKVDIILGGHLHRAFIGNSLDFYPGAHRDRGIIIAQCGTTTSRRGRGREQEKNSLNQIEISMAMITIEHFMYFQESDEFEMVSRHSFRRGSIPKATSTPQRE
jgi:3',5'-cyclic AMP phosphodiesterase CpdA